MFGTVRILIVFAILTTLCFPTESSISQVAVAVFTPLAAGTSSISGWAVFQNYNATFVNVTISISGIQTNPDSEHGIHIHTYGDVSDPTGNAAGGHYDPFNAVHIHTCPENGTFTRPVGDMGNWQATGGVISQSKLLANMNLTGTNSIVGRGVVLHAATDNCYTLASSASRMAIGVIGVANLGLTTNFASSQSTYGGSVIGGCSITGTTSMPDLSGQFTFSQSVVNGSVQVLGFLTTTTPHAIHVHTYGDLTDPTGSSTGAHFDPFLTNFHSLPTDSTPHHQGDLGNVDDSDIIDNYSWYNLNFSTSLLTVDGNGGIGSVIGRGVTVHNATDGGSAYQPTGIPSGPGTTRFGVCVIGIINPTLTKLPLTLPSPTAPTAPAPSGEAAASFLSFVVVALFAVLGLLLH